MGVSTVCRDKIHVAIHAPEQPGKGARIIRRVVYPIEKYIFKGYAATRCLNIFLTGWNQLLQRIFPVNGHEPILQGVVAGASLSIVVSQYTGKVEYLVNYLAGSQIALKALLSASAERAAHSTANLCL
jgi:hypothetical protein